MLPILRLLTTVLGRAGEAEKQPWQKGNSWLINTSILPEFVVTKLSYKNGYSSENLTSGITDVIFTSRQVYYTNMYSVENLTVGIADITFAVTKI